MQEGPYEEDEETVPRFQFGMQTAPEYVRKNLFNLVFVIENCLKF